MRSEKEREREDGGEREGEKERRNAFLCTSRAYVLEGMRDVSDRKSVV